MGKKVAEILVEVLEQAGVERCYGIVGDTLNLFAESLDKSSIEWVHVRHEEAGAFAAGAEAQLTGGLTACAGSCGPGSLHFINGLYEANRNRSPVVLIASQIMSSELGFEFIQEVDFKSLFKECSVYCEQIYTPEQARRKVVAACQAAIALKGVAVLIVPVDMSHGEVKEDFPYRVHNAQPLIRPNDQEISDIAKILNEGQKIAIYAGSGCEGALDEIKAVADRLKAPVAHTSRAKDALAYDNPYNVGMTGILGNEAGYNAILECDTLLMLGADFAWRQFYPDHAQIVQIDIKPTHLGRRHHVSLGAVGDVKATLQALLPHLEENPDESFLGEFVDRYKKVIEETQKHLKPGHDDTIPASYLMSRINKYAADDSLLVADDGSPIVWATRHFDANGKRRIFGSLLHGTMASALSSSFGLQKAAPDRQVIACCGDGGLTMLFGELITTIQENIPVKIIVFDNGKLGFVEIEQKAEGILDTFTKLKNPDFGKVAEAIGLWGKTVNKAADLDGAIQELLAQPGPGLLNVIVNQLELVKPPMIELKPVVGMALYSARAILHGRGADVLEMIRENI
ncbi:pyruvate dehydrogenase (quinone) [Dyella jiangningensis]|uniref:thiamine pyrophosphate-dependent enzyme n=1 Tax=Dyella sp. AtDHG13 TaxID=1938897 RepID=UPI0008895086|nr:thiamine pyrophosphate-dependent enzyme [Dyella sp. AtDHG13]PXV59868.1 pyruvate dehydrogenase (quinone) [Dyella sp. AtDHG13]SDJ19507.1 pyruvate dehydrogenase (quinone) [Dyella jiangningensis]